MNLTEVLCGFYSFKVCSGSWENVSICIKELDYDGGLQHELVEEGELVAPLEPHQSIHHIHHIHHTTLHLYIYEVVISVCLCGCPIIYSI